MFSPCSPIVMLLGVTLLKKKYPMAKYMCVLLIVAGVALFMYKPKKVAGMEEHTIGYGELLLVCGSARSFPKPSLGTSPPRQADASCVSGEKLRNTSLSILVFVSYFIAHDSAKAMMGGWKLIVIPQFFSGERLLSLSLYIGRMPQSS